MAPSARQWHQNSARCADIIYMNPSCDMCGLQRSCDAKRTAIYAENALLRARLREALSSACLSPDEDNGLFVFPLEQPAELIVRRLSQHLSEPEQDDLRIGPFSIGGLVAAPRFRSFARKLGSSWFDEALHSDRYSFHFQPIVDLASWAIHGYECLVRLFDERPYSGGEILQAAVERGHLHVFDAYCRQKALRSGAAAIPPGTKLFINFMPSSIYNPEYCLKTTVETVNQIGRFRDDVIFEVVESEQVTSVTHLLKIRDFYKSRGFGFALDDVGSGANSLRMVADFQPDYIKLDKSLTSGLANPMRQAVVRKFMEFAFEFGIKVIAEGVETAVQARMLRDAGVTLMQGWWFGRPGPAAIDPTSLIALAVALEKSHALQPAS